MAAAPILDKNAIPKFTAIVENSVVPSGIAGTLVSALIDSGGSLNNFSDSDGDSPAIAITATNLAGGTLYFTTDGGSTWSDVGTVSDSSARVLHADNNTRLAFVPAVNFTGAISDLVTFKAWDRTGVESISSNPTLTGSIDIAGSAEDVTLSADGNTAYIADGNDGLKIIDLGHQQHFSGNADTASIDILAAPTPTPSPTPEWDQITEQSSVTNKVLSTPISIGNRSYINAILGTSGRDKIKGTALDEIIASGATKDKLKGGAGADAFIFNTPGGFGNLQKDIITDFSSSQGDTLVLSSDQFSSLKSFKTVLKRGQLNRLASRTDISILYFQKLGQLYYNEIGSDDGFGDGGVFARLKGAPELGVSDFTIV